MEADNYLKGPYRPSIDHYALRASVVVFVIMIARFAILNLNLLFLHVLKVI